MCGRYVSVSSTTILVERFTIERRGIDRDGAQLQRGPDPRCRSSRRVRRPHPRPGALGPRAVLGEGPVDRRAQINARAESITEAAYKRGIRTQGCIVPADGFYEWEKTRGRQAEAAVVHPPPRRGAARVRGTVGDLARPEGRRRRAAHPDVHDHHDRGQRPAGADPRAHARRAPGIGMGPLARSRVPGRRRAAAVARPGTGRPVRDVAGLDTREQGRQRRPGTDRTRRR